MRACACVWVYLMLYRFNMWAAKYAAAAAAAASSPAGKGGDVYMREHVCAWWLSAICEATLYRFSENTHVCARLRVNV